ncbi:MAG: hypothetical protein RBT57_07990 [Paludibacter sp.]|jgi:hypothetical protein|nr:hypothetical protein [Paludibacter sp.]
MNDNKLIKQALVLSFLALVAGSLMHFFELTVGKFVFGGGAAIIILIQLIFLLKEPAEGFRAQRLQRMNFMVSLVLALGVYSMVEGTTLWIAAILIYALVTLFLSFRN